MAKTAIVLGATGFTGNILLKMLLEDDRYGQIRVFGRNSCNIKHPKLEEYIIDLFELAHYSNKFNADEVFCCIGTTKAKTSNKEIYTKIDFGIPVAAAKLCRENDIKTYVVISALGAKKNSRVFYNRTKGKMEAVVLEQQIENTYILKPSLISGKRKEFRLGEYLFNAVMSLFKPLFKFGSLKRYKPIAPETIAKCMIWLTNNNYDSGRIESEKIHELGE
ncbi:NAD(P)H-binding protein [Gelidibacter maritimus]|uniref:NAD(P)H-binding protein n=1 Tax=Gelidibacter maritimus TaxID=2761487 RepID=A0A7W2M353_9FLAO|nr:NAD(P)H-binding protein [Gelidibacter maritimus]MBA6151802.1 NAD(P)H-binding protein [Gelidibacter maritimus]